MRRDSCIHRPFPSLACGLYCNSYSILWNLKKWFRWGLWLQYQNIIIYNGKGCNVLGVQFAGVKVRTFQFKALENSQHFMTPPLVSPWNDISEKWVQKFHTDDMSLPRSGFCFLLTGWSFQLIRSTHFSDVISWGNHCNMLAVFLGYLPISCFHYCTCSCKLNAVPTV